MIAKKSSCPVGGKGLTSMHLLLVRNYAKFSFRYIDMILHINEVRFYLSFLLVDLILSKYVCIRYIFLTVYRYAFIILTSTINYCVLIIHLLHQLCSEEE